MRVLVSLLVAAAAMLCVCALTYYGIYQLFRPEHIAPEQRPAEEDLVGVWTLNSSSLKRMQDELGYEVSVYRLTLRQDGTFELVNMPKWRPPLDESTGTFYSGSGTWKISNLGDHWHIALRFSSLDGYEQGMNTSFYLAGPEPPYLIYNYFGDPDEYNYIEFERK